MRKISAVPVVGSLRHHVMGGILQTFFSAVMLTEVMLITRAMGWEDRLVIEDSAVALALALGALAFYLEYVRVWLDTTNPEELARLHLGLVVWHFTRWSLFLGALSTSRQDLITAAYSMELVAITLKVLVDCLRWR